MSKEGPFSRNLSAFLAAKHGFNKGVKGSIHDVLDVSSFFACAEVLNHLVRLEYVGTNLAAPADLSFIGISAVRFGFLLVFLNLVKFGSEGFPSDFAVAELGPFLGGANHDACWEMLHHNSGFDLVYILATFTA